MQIGLGLSITSQLRFGTALYAVNSFDPDFVLDFKNSYYRKGGSNSTLSGSVTHARAGNATMVDSDGLLKYAPHNLLSYSQDFSSWPTSSNTTITSNTIIAPDGTTTADSAVFDGNANARVEQGIAQTGSRVIAVWMKVPSGTQGVYIGFTSGDLSLVTVTDQWVLYSYESASGTFPRINCRDIATVHLWGAHAYRSDLGGMVNNPSQPTGLETYVPTTSSAVYAPRVGHHVYNGSAWVNEGVLHESEARTNLYLNSSETATNSSFDITKTSDSAVSPDGTTTADLITPINAGRHLFQYSSSFSANDGSNETYSFYAKSNGYNLFEVSQRNQGGGTITKFDLSAVTATTTSGTEIFKSIEDVGNGWYRCSASYITSSTNPYPAVEFLDTDGSQGFTADGTSGIYFWGHQLEAGSTPSSYIPTSGSTVTRAAETLTVPAANLPYSSSNMSIQIDGRMTYSDISSSVEVRIYYWYKDSLNNIYTYLDTRSTRTGQVDFYQENGGVVDIVQGSSTSYSPGILVPFNLSSRHGATFLNGAIDGTALTVNTTPSALPDLSSTNLAVGAGFMGTIGKFRMWDEDLTDTGIEEAST